RHNRASRSGAVPDVPDDPGTEEFRNTRPHHVELGSYIGGFLSAQVTALRKHRDLPGPLENWCLLQRHFARNVFDDRGVFIPAPEVKDPLVCLLLDDEVKLGTASKRFAGPAEWNPSSAQSLTCPMLDYNGAVGGGRVQKQQHYEDNQGRHHIVQY